MWKAPLNMNRSKVYLHVEQSLLKINYKLGETLLYNQGCKKYSHKIGYKGKGSDRVEP